MSPHPPRQKRSRASDQFSCERGSYSSDCTSYFLKIPIGTRRERYISVSLASVEGHSSQSERHTQRRLLVVRVLAPSATRPALYTTLRFVRVCARQAPQEKGLHHSVDRLSGAKGARACRSHEHVAVFGDCRRLEQRWRHSCHRKTSGVHMLAQEV